MIKRKALEPLIASILLIVISVVLITAILSWGTLFTNDSLNKVNESVLEKSNVSSFIWFFKVIGQNVLIKNLSSESFFVISYKIILPANHPLSKYYEKAILFNAPIQINANTTTLIPIDCFPNSKFDIDLITDNNQFVNIKVIFAPFKNFLDCGLSGYWPLNEDSGDVVLDVSKYNNDGILINGVVREESLFGNVLSFDGINQYVNFPVLNLFNNISENDFTISFWLNSRDLNTYSNWTRIIDITKDSQNYTQFVINGTKNIQFLVTDSGTSRYVNTNYSLQTNTWYFLTGVWNSNSKVLDIFVNGQLKTKAGIQGGVSGSPSTFNIGRRSNNAGYYNGLISNVRIYNRILTNEEIIKLYELV